MNGKAMKIDALGRIVIPKPVRDSLRLKPGSQLDLVEREEGILLRTVGPPPPALIQKNGLIIHRGEAPKGFRWDRLTEDQQDE